jgi:hypothetical protein
MRNTSATSCRPFKLLIEFNWSGERRGAISRLQRRPATPPALLLSGHFEERSVRRYLFTTELLARKRNT